MTGTGTPSVMVFDVNETLSDLSGMAERFADVGAPGHLAALWFASVLRDGFALTAAGASARFVELATGQLHVVLAAVELDRGRQDAVEHVMQAFVSLPVHPDVPEGLRRLAGLGLRLVALSNGSTSVAEGLLERADLAEHVERLMSVEQAGVWKPAPGSYLYAAAECGVAAGELMLVSVHPWDVDGAARAGLAAVWLNRTGAPYPSYLTAPDLAVGSLPELATSLSARGR